MSKFSAERLSIKSVKAFYDEGTHTEVRETASMLFYKTRTFYCQVAVDVLASTADSDWTIGLVQACDKMHLANEYDGRGRSLWEFHPLKSGLRAMINDSDGRQYPFYSVSQSVHCVRRGVVKKGNFTLQIKDYFHPSVVWELPYCGGVHLTEISRHQKFLIWLIIIKHARKGATNEEELTVLKKIRWVYDLLITIDPFMPLGERVQQIFDVQDDNILIVDPEHRTRLPLAAASPPHCNAAQSLIWYPKDPLKHPRVLVPPKQIVVPWNNWVQDMLGYKARVRQPSEVICIANN